MSRGLTSEPYDSKRPSPLLGKKRITREPNKKGIYDTNTRGRRVIPIDTIKKKISQRTPF